MKKQWIYILCSLAMLAAMTVVGCGGDNGGEGADPAQGLSREQFLTEYGLADQIVLMEFGTVDEDLSDQGLRAMMDLQRRGAIPGLAYARVELSTDEASVQEYYRELSPTFPMIRDPKKQIMDLFGAKAVPTFILLDSFGRVRYRGGFPTGNLHDWVVAMKDEATDPGPAAPQFGKVSIDGPTLLRQTVLPALEADAKPLASYAGPNGLLAVVIDTQCPFAATAREEMGKVSDVLKKHAVDSVLINIDDAPEVVKHFYADKNLPVHLLYDASGRTQHSWGIGSVPTVVYFDADGAIRYNGKAVWQELAVAVSNTLGLPEGEVNFQAKGTEYG
jgi:peroxiredoxin